MSIAPELSNTQSARSNTMLLLNEIARIVENASPHDAEHQIRLVGRLHETTHIAADSSDALSDEYRAAYYAALGREEAVSFLLTFNRTCEAWKEKLQGNKKHTPFQPRPADKAKILAGLGRLEEKAKENFFLPFPGMNMIATPTARRR